MKSLKHLAVCCGIASFFLISVQHLAFSQVRPVDSSPIVNATPSPQGLSEDADALEAQPNIGFVVSSNGVVVRDRYPTVNVKGGYQLGEKICSVGRGVGFNILKTQTLLNQEVWYRVESLGDIEATSVDCGSSATGWVVGKLNDGKVLVATTAVTQDKLSQVEPSSSPKLVQSTLVPDGETNSEGKAMKPPAPEKPDEEELPEDRGTGSLLLWWNYVAIALGTVTGNLFMDLDSGRIKSRQYWKDYANLFRLLMLVGFNLILLNVACSNFTLLSIGILKSLPTLIKSFWGTFIAGIVIVVLILKAIASSDVSGD